MLVVWDVLHAFAKIIFNKEEFSRNLNSIVELARKFFIFSTERAAALILTSVEWKDILQLHFLQSQRLMILELFRLAYLQLYFSDIIYYYNGAEKCNLHLYNSHVIISTPTEETYHCYWIGWNIVLFPFPCYSS